MRTKGEEETLDAYLAHKVFAGKTAVRVMPDPRDVEGFDTFIKRYTTGLTIERAAVTALR